MKISERIKQREAAAATRAKQREEQHRQMVEDEDRWDITYQWGSVGNIHLESNACLPEVTPKDLATVKAKPSVWQKIKGWFYEH